jgi:hypothetical protein
MLPRSTDGYARLEQELHQERASALGRIGRTLESWLTRMEVIRVAASRPDADHVRLAAEHAAARAAALRWRWYLEVQREAVGIRRHDRLDEMYPVPPPLACPPASIP